MSAKPTTHLGSITVVSTPSGIAYSSKPKPLKSLVGTSNLPNQVHRRATKKGFYFTLMVVGESGLGKSTLINTLFNAYLYQDQQEKDSRQLDETNLSVEIKAISADIQESGVKLRLTVVDTPGFGDFVNNEKSYQPILENIESRFDLYLDQETKVSRDKINDTRIHACLYFISPTGHCLKPLDIEFMKRVHDKVNLIPIISKADTLTDEEIVSFKQRILDDVIENNITIFRPSSHEHDDPETISEISEIINKLPFAVVGSTSEFSINGRKLRGRQYPWGIVEVDNPEHNDFVKLRQMLIRTNMEELRSATNDVLYEKYRTHKLLSIGIPQDHSVFGENDSSLRVNEDKKAHEARMLKMESEMKAVFQQKVSEKEQKLKNSEEELYTRHKELKQTLEKQRLDLEERKKRLESGVRPATPEKAKKKGFPF